MSEIFPKTLVIDIGKAWTKAFLVTSEKGNLILEKKLSLPTSIGDVGFTVGKEIERISPDKDTLVIITGALSEAEAFATTIKAKYVSEENSQKAFKDWLEGTGFKKAVFLDAGNYSYAPNTKIDQIGAFLTNEMTDVEIENYLGNKSIKPHNIPVKNQELEVEEAFFRFAFSGNRDFFHAKELVNLVVTGSFFSLSPKQSHLALILLDILTRGKSAQVKLDRLLFMHSFGALLVENPEVANFKTDFLLDLGAFVALGGRGNVMLDYGFTDNQELSVVEDEIALVPAHNNQQITLTFMDTKEKKKIVVHGGAFGILLDGRVKPLKLAFASKESRDSMKRWHSAIDKLELIQ